MLRKEPSALKQKASKECLIFVLCVKIVEEKKNHPNVIALHFDVIVLYLRLSEYLHG